jgi:hypothetical protein
MKEKEARLAIVHVLDLDPRHPTTAYVKRREMLQRQFDHEAKVLK